MNIFKIILLTLVFLSNQSFSQTYLQQLGAAINGEAAEDRSGNSISNSNDGYTVVIGAYFNDGNGSNSGHVRVYEWNSTTWIQKGLDINGEAAEDRSGFSVSLSANGNIVAIGAPSNDGIGLNAGHTRVYSWNSSSWIQLGSDIDGEAAGDVFGSSVALSDDGLTLAVGATGNDDNGIDAGHVRVYNWNGFAWIRKGIDINGENADDLSGGSVSLNSDGNILAIGAAANDGNGFGAGHARVFYWNGSAWIQRGIDIDGVAASNFCGKSLQLDNSGNRLIVGSPYNSFLQGHARIFEWNGIAWVQLGADILGEDLNEQFGVSVGISGDGNTIIAGAFGNSDAGSLAGSARVYNWNGSIWQQVGNDLDGVSADDQCGVSVSISGNSNIFSVAAYLNATTGPTAGHVRNWNICEVVNSIDTHVVCQSYTWINGITYTSNNNTATYTYPRAAATGCDSVVTLNLTIIPSSQGTDVITSCGSYTWLNAVTYTSNNNTATYTYSGGAYTGCDSIVTLNLTIIPNSRSTDTIVSCTPITWIDGNTYNTSNNTATYSYSGGAINGCDSIVSLKLTINSVTNNTTSNSGNTITANNTLASYVWLDCDNNYSIIPAQTNRSFTPTVNGNYAVQLTQNGCVDTSACVLINSVNIHEKTIENTMSIYPNPTTGNFTIDLGQALEQTVIEISDLQGRILLHQEFSTTKIIDMTLIEPSGIYILSISNPQGKSFIKLVKE